MKCVRVMLGSHTFCIVVVVNKTVHNTITTSSSGTSSSSGKRSSSGAVGKPDGVDSSGTVKQKRLSGNTSPNMDNLRAQTPTGIEIIIRVLADESIWQKAKIWAVVSHPVWQAHSREDSGLKTPDAIIKCYRAYSKGMYIQHLGKVC